MHTEDRNSSESALENVGPIAQGRHRHPRGSRGSGRTPQRPLSAGGPFGSRDSEPSGKSLACKSF